MTKEDEINMEALRSMACNTKPVACARCGMCCLMGCCRQGVEHEDDGYCKYLVINPDYTTSCQLVLEGKHDPNIITIGWGCYLQGTDELYAEYLHTLKPRKDMIKERGIS